MPNKTPLLIARHNREGQTLKGAVAAAPRRRGRPSRDDVAMPREEILLRAFAAFARDGYDGVSLRSLARECGISDSLISHHFGSKPALWEEAADSVFQPIYARLLALIDSLAAAGNDPITVLRTNLPQALKLLAAEPVLVQFMFREGEGDDVRGEYLREKYLRPYLARVDALFAQAQTLGNYRPVSPESRHVLVLGLMRSLALPGLMRNELTAHLATPEAMAAFIDDATAVIYGGLLLHPHEKSSVATPSTGNRS